MANSYLFYDIETTGLNPCFDQALQFAAIRTDLSLNETERFKINIRLNPDITPHPEAMKTHGISLTEIAKGENEYDAMKKIYRLMNTPGTISLGYNTLGFDDEFLRFSFYRNLLPPYTHQFANGCSRMDIYPITLLYYLFKPEVIEWPKIDERISLKLEKINETNRFSKGKAHDAMVDVEVTLALARSFYQETDIWKYIGSYFSKEQDSERLRKLTQGVAMEGKFGTDHNFLAPIISLGQHRIYKNHSLWLRLDDERLPETTIDSIANTTFAVRKKAGETPLIFPNQDRFQNKLTKDRQKLRDINLDFIEKNRPLFKAIQDYHQNYTYPIIKGVDADAALYMISFPSHEEERLFRKFHQASPKEKQNIMALFPNTVRKEQALRILGRHFPDSLTQENKLLFEDYLQHSHQQDILDYKGSMKFRNSNDC